MPLVSIQLPEGNTANLNHSLQVGDTLYYVPINTVGVFDVGENEDIVELGPYLGQGDINYGIDQLPYSATSSVWTLVQNGTPLPENGDFLLFSKDNVVNENGLLGYYMSVKLENNSDEYAELFSVGTEVFESSK